MLARELADASFPTDFDAAEAARPLSERRLAGPVDLDDAGPTHSVLPGSQVLRFVTPGLHASSSRATQDAPMLARVWLRYFAVAG